MTTMDRAGMVTDYLEMGLVSVVVPTYNRADCIERAVDSILEQSYSNLEVIVVDDGSTDDTQRRLRYRYSADGRVRRIEQENQGAAAARNAGLKLARGEYLAFLDSDDAWKKWKLELQLESLAVFPEAGMIWTDMEAIGSDGRTVERKYLRRMYGAYRSYPLERLFSRSGRVRDLSKPGGAAQAAVYSGCIFTPMMTGNLVHTSTVLLRRDRLEKVGGFREDLRYSGEDYDFHLRTCLVGAVAFLDLSSIEYQIGRSDRLTHPSYNIHISRNFLRTITPMIERERERIRLSDKDLSTLQARAHAWVGREALKCGSTEEARRHLRHSLSYQTMHLPTVGLFLVASLPWFVFRWLTSARRIAKAALLRSAH